MTQPSGPSAAGHCELRIDGHLDHHWSAWFGGLSLIHEDDGTTTLRGPFADQAQLHGLLAKVRDLGVTLISVNNTDTSGSRDPGATPPTPPSRNPSQKGSRS